MTAGFLPTTTSSVSTPQSGVVVTSDKRPLYWSRSPFKDQIMQAKKGDAFQSNSKPSPDTEASEPTETAFSPEEAKRLNVLVQTDALLDNPKFEPVHASLIGLTEGAKIGALVGLPLSTIMMGLRAVQAHHEKNNIESFLRKIPQSTFAVFGFKAFEHLTYEGKDWEMKALKRIAKVVYGTGVSAAIGGLFFGPAVSFLIVSNARSKLQNIKRSIKNDYKDYKPDWIDKHFSHIDKVEDPQTEYNKVRQELTNKKDAAANGFHTAVFVKLLTLGSKIVAAGMLGGLFELGRHSYGYWDKVQDRPKNSHRDYTGKDSDLLELNNYVREKQDLLYGPHTQGHPYEEIGLYFRHNEASRKEMDHLEKSAKTLISSLEKSSFKNWMTYVNIRLKHSPITHLLKETGVHLINPLMIGNFLVTPAVVALSMIPFFVHEAGIEPYQQANPEGSRWKKILKGIRLSPQKEINPKKD